MSPERLTGEQWLRVRALFEAGLEQPPATRRSWLAAETEDDPTVRQEVERLLEQDLEDGSWLDGGAPESAVRDALGASSAQPRSFGPFRILDTLGSGGHATVFLAEQSDPSRRVALKVLRNGLHAEAAHRRFSYESEVLANLRHPGIAQVYATGTQQDPLSGAQVPYFAMELVEGARSLTSYARDRELSLPVTLELFLQVCEAVHSGHQRGVVHRDLKPQNILVDEAGHPKVIDFGIARALTSVGEDPSLTLPGELLGTLSYMSPEQVEGDPALVDLRADVYALGVVLFELVTGQLPFADEGRSLTEHVTVIREREAPRASSVEGRFSGDRLAGDLDWVIAKALTKEPERRYGSVSEFAADVRRALEGEPVQAHPPSARYAFGKFVRRHRAAVVAACASAVILVAALVLVTDSLFEVRRAERETRESLAAAELEVETRRVVGDFLSGLLRSPDPYVEGRDVKVLDLLDRAADSATEMHQDRPALAATLRETLGRSYLGLGDAEAARPHLERARELALAAWGAEDLRTLEATHELADALMQSGDLETAGALNEQVLEQRVRILGEAHVDTAGSRALAGHIAYRRDELEEAAAQFEAARGVWIDLRGPGARMSVSTSAALGAVLDRLGQDDRAREVLELAVSDGTEALGAEHPSVLIAVNNLALLLLSKGDHERAAEMFERILVVQERVLGPEHDDVLLSLNNIAGAKQKLGDFVAAERLFRELLSRREAAGKRRAVRTVVCLGNLGVCLESMNQLDAADLRFNECLALAKELGIPERHWLAAAFRKGLAVVRTKQGRYDEAESMLKQCIADFDASSAGDQSARRRKALEALAANYRAWGKPEDAAAIDAQLRRG